MHRTLTILFRRDPERDGMHGEIPVEGYQVSWPDGRAVAVGLTAFCKHGLRLLGLKACMTGCSERLVELTCFPVTNRDANLTRQPGYRIRRFYLARSETLGRLHFLDGFPTDVVFDLDRDDPEVLDWIGLRALQDGQRQWLDLAARGVEAEMIPAGLLTTSDNEGAQSESVPACQSTPSPPEPCGS